jgi:hypothetical protein
VQRTQKQTSIINKIICRYYSFNEELIHLPNLENQDENIEHRATRKILVQIFFNLIQHHNEEWVQSNIAFLFEIANCNEDSLKEVYSISKIYPNQLNQLKSSNELKRDIDIMSEIKTLYNKVKGAKLKKV